MRIIFDFFSMVQKSLKKNINKKKRKEIKYGRIIVRLNKAFFKYFLISIHKFKFIKL